MKLSSLTPQDKIKLAAELGGWTVGKTTCVSPDGHSWDLFRFELDDFLPNYATSYDAIIPLIQKLCKDSTLYNKFADQLIYGEYSASAQLYGETPSQLLDALLVATGKAEV